MYDSIHIKNFRGIEDLTIKNLGRVNLLVGANNVGKTSVLEALDLLHSQYRPGALLDALVKRGLIPERMTPDQIVEGLTFDPSKPATIEAYRDEHNLRKVSIHSPSASSEANVNGASVKTDWLLQLLSSTRESKRWIQFTYYTNDPNVPTGSQDWEETFVLGADPRTLERNEIDRGFGPGVYLSAGEHISTDELALRFSRIEDEGRSASVLIGLRTLEPRVDRVYVALDRIGNTDVQPSVRVGMSGIPKPILLRMMGGGLGRAADMLVSLPLASGGVALIDEIETGTYYENLKLVWRLVDQTSQVSSVQVFATTHSLECVDSVLDAFERDGAAQSGFRLHRIERDDGGLRCVTYSFVDLQQTRVLNWEFR